MSRGPAVDYDALAQQHGGSAAVDYDALAAQHGGQSAAPKLTQNGQEVPEGGFGVGHYLKQAIPSGGDLVHAVGLPASADEWKQRSEAENAKTAWQRAKDALPIMVPPGIPIVASMAKEAFRAARHPLDPEAPIHAFSAMNPFAAPVVDQMSEQGLGTKEANATGLVNAAMMAGGMAAPKVMGKVANMAPDLAAKAQAVAKLIPREITGKIPIAGRVDSLRTPTFGDYWGALQSKADSQMALFNKTPKLGNSQVMATADKPLSATPIQDALFKPAAPAVKVGDAVEGPMGMTRAISKDGKSLGSITYEVKGDTATVHHFGGPESDYNAFSNELGRSGLRDVANQLQAEHPELQKIEGIRIGGAKGEEGRSVTIPLNKAVPAASPATPAASSTVPRVLSGEGVLNEALTGLDNKSLLKVARSRGIDVSQEAQLKPGKADQKIINKIIDNFSPDELEELRNHGLEVGRNKAAAPQGLTPEQGKELWHYKVLGTYFPDVAVPKAMEARARFYMSKRPGMQPTAASPAAGPPQGVSPVQVTNASNLEDLLRQSLNLTPKR